MSATVIRGAEQPGGRAHLLHRGLRHPAVPVLLVAVVAAAWTASRARGMWTAPGSMGLGPGPFVVIWSLMMAAMMLPSVTPTAVLYIRSLSSRRTASGASFIAGYALIWAGSGLGAYALAVGADRVVRSGGLAPRIFAATVFAATAVFYLTPWKYRMLGYCRNPIGLIIHYGIYRGHVRHLGAGLHHGTTCLGCCWSLMALMTVFGMMNVAAMAALALVVAVEKLWVGGVGFARTVGVVSGALAVLVLLVPGLAVGLTGAASGMSM